jgi:ABC-type antimicrobial peptide transport system ATPase subunit
MSQITAFIGRANSHKITLLQNKAPVPANVVERAVLRFGDYCLDTDDLSMLFEDNNTALRVKIGLTPLLVAGNYAGVLTVYDAAAVEGLAWDEIKIAVKVWRDCT